MLYSERCELLLVAKEPNSLCNIRKSPPAALLHLSKQPPLRSRTEKKEEETSELKFTPTEERSTH